MSFDRGVSLMAGWVAREEYSQTAVNSLLTGLGVTGTIPLTGGGPVKLGAGVTAAPLNGGCAAVELGVTSGAGISAGWGFEGPNLLDRLGL